MSQLLDFTVTLCPRVRRNLSHAANVCVVSLSMQSVQVAHRLEVPPKSTADRVDGTRVPQPCWHPPECVRPAVSNGQVRVPCAAVCAHVPSCPRPVRFVFLGLTGFCVFLCVCVPVCPGIEVPCTMRRMPFMP